MAPGSLCTFSKAERVEFGVESERRKTGGRRSNVEEKSRTAPGSRGTFSKVELLKFGVADAFVAALLGAKYELKKRR